MAHKKQEKDTYDFLDERETILSADGKHPDIILIRGFNYRDCLLEVGRKGFLRGRALRVYQELENVTSGTARD